MAGDRYSRDHDAYVLEGRYLNFSQALDYLDDKGFDWQDATRYLRLLWTDAHARSTSQDDRSGGRRR